MPQLLRILLCWLILLAASVTYIRAQQSILFKISSDNAPHYTALQQFNKEVINTSDTFVLNDVVFRYVEQLKMKAWESGFLAFSVDTFYQLTDSFYVAELYTGQPYRFAKLYLDSLPLVVRNSIGTQITALEGKSVSVKKFTLVCKKIINYYENSGYPFAALHVKSLNDLDTSIQAYLIVEPHHKVFIDTIVIQSDVKISRSFIQNYLGIHQGQAYNEQALQQISKKLHELTFLKPAADPQMTFTIAESRLWLYLQQKKANQINGLIGLQPGNSQLGQRFVLTVDALLHLKNALGYGETIAAIFQQLQPSSPRFNFKVEYPYVNNTPFSLDMQFDLYKKDTLFNRVTFDFGVKYLLNHRDYIRLGYINNANRIISPDLKYIIANKHLPNNVDVKNNGAIVSFNLDRTDYTLNPKRGPFLLGQLQYLNRKILKNAAITALQDNSGFDFNSLYDTFKLNSNQYKIQVQTGWYIPATSTIVFKLGYNVGYISGKQLFLNELYQIGGFSLLRGFDELSLFVNQYHMLTAEARFIINTNSFFYVFSDNAFIQTKYNVSNATNYPMGLGIGLNLENSGGIFKIAIGVGKLEGSNFMLRQAKLHFGYVAYF